MEKQQIKTKYYTLNVRQYSYSGLTADVEWIECENDKMKKHLKILILEDSPDDVDLIERQLRKGGITFTPVVVKRKIEFENALKEFSPDVIISDHSLPHFNSIEALQLYKEYQLS